VRDLIILGTGVHAVEMAEIVERINQAQPTWRFLGHVAPSDHPTGPVLGGNRVLGAAECLADYPDAWMVPDNASPIPAQVPRDRFASLIDPSAFVSRSARVGRGCVIYPHCFVGLNVRIDDFVFMLSGCAVNHDDILGERVVMASGVRLAGAVHVEEQCYLGQGCAVRQYLRIGRRALIGMGAVVVQDVPPNAVMVGNPARKLRERE